MTNAYKVLTKLYRSWMVDVLYYMKVYSEIEIGQPIIADFSWSYSKSHNKTDILHDIKTPPVFEVKILTKKKKTQNIFVWNIFFVRTFTTVRERSHWKQFYIFGYIYYSKHRHSYNAKRKLLTPEMSRKFFFLNIERNKTFVKFHFHRLLPTVHLGKEIDWKSFNIKFRFIRRRQ